MVGGKGAGLRAIAMTLKELTLKLINVDRAYYWSKVSNINLFFGHVRRKYAER